MFVYNRCIQFTTRTCSHMKCCFGIGALFYLLSFTLFCRLPNNWGDNVRQIRMLVLFTFTQFGGTPSPATDFKGTDGSATWGPSIGFYLTMGAFIEIPAGAVFMFLCW